jgi:hypothetical protein
MYRLVISRDTIDSLMGSNLNEFRLYGGDAAADMETERWLWLCGVDLMGWRRRDWEDSKKEVLGFEEREGAKVVAMVAIGLRK